MIEPPETSNRPIPAEARKIRLTLSLFVRSFYSDPASDYFRLTSTIYAYTWPPWTSCATNSSPPSPPREITHAPRNLSSSSSSFPPFISRPPFLFPLINPTRLLSLIYLLLSKPPARDVAGHRAMTGQHRTRQKIERSRAVSLRTAGRYVIDDDSIIGEQTSVSRPV